MNHEFLVGSSVKREISLVASWVEIYMNEIINKLKPRKGGEINRGPSIRQRPCLSRPEPEGGLLKMGILVSVTIPTSQMSYEKWDAIFPSPISHFYILISHSWIPTSHFLNLTSHFKFWSRNNKVYHLVMINLHFYQ